MKKPHMSFEDPSYWILRSIRKLHSLRLKWTYPFASVGHHFSAHYSCDLRRAKASYMRIGNFVLLERHVRVDIPLVPSKDELVIMIDDGCIFGQRTTILAINRVHIERNNIFAPHVLRSHEHCEFRLAARPRGPGCSMWLCTPQLALHQIGRAHV